MSDWLCPFPKIRAQSEEFLVALSVAPETKRFRSTRSTPKSTNKWYARRDSNPQPSEPESDALSIEPLAHINLNCKADYSRFSKFCKEVTEFLFAACGAAAINYFAQEFCLTFDIKATIMKKADEALKVSWI